MGDNFIPRLRDLEPVVNGTATPPGVRQHHNASSNVVEVPYLIVGTGPAGAALACFLAQNDLTGLIVSRDPASANTPRAHITNMAAIDCLRDIGLDEECYKQGTVGDTMIHTRWSRSFAGEEWGRIYSWGNDPRRKGDYELASPSSMLDLPQTILEPILMRYATLNGFNVRWNTKFISFVEHDKGVDTTLLDLLTNQTFVIRSRLLFGADGARSNILTQAQIPLINPGGQGFAVNILFDADLTHLMSSRMGNLHWLLTPDKEFSEHAWIGCLRMIVPWTKWICVIFPHPTAERKLLPASDYVDRLKEWIGDDSVKFQITGISTWAINEIVAEYFSKGKVHCLGDAVHRHPPNHGLGSNTCIQDAHNLAWKVAYVHKGLAGPELLQTFSDERQPVGLHVVTMANASLRNHRMIWDVLGMLEPDLERRKAICRELEEDSPAGQRRRADLQTALSRINREEHGLGIEMNQRYKSSAIYHLDQGSAPSFDTDELEHYHPTTYPGARLPHVWLQKAVPSNRISTYDLAGKGRFTLFTGIGGFEWKKAADAVSAELEIPFATYSIGYRQDYNDTYLDWSKIRGVDDSGCVVVRPDYFVVWRSTRWENDSSQKLMEVMRIILSRPT